MQQNESISPNDRRFVYVDDDYEIRYWTAALGVTEHALKNAVQAVGNRSADVREYLGK